MATGSGKAAIFLHLHNGGRKTLPILLTYVLGNTELAHCHIVALTLLCYFGLTGHVYRLFQGSTRTTSSGCLMPHS